VKKIARYFLVLIFFSLFSFQESSAELLKPNNELKPFDVVKIQLSALKNNNKPYLPTLQIKNLPVHFHDLLNY